jgi:8-oxo-dGTP pyrophosphatase MutT (NUDIX family)
MLNPTHRGLTADMFVLRGNEFLTLTRAGGLGEGLEYLPGGIVDVGEDPAHAAVRETHEESGLQVTNSSLLRVWTYPTPEGWDTVHATYVGFSDDGEPVLSHEHSDFQWTTPAAYIAKWCSEDLEAALPTHARWLREVRTNCELIDALLDRPADR